MTDRGLLKFFLKYASRHKARYLAAFALMPLFAILMSTAPKITQKAIDDGIMQADLGYTSRAAFLYLAFVVGAFFIMVLQTYLLQVAGIRTLTDIRDAVMQHICFLGKSRYDQQPLGVYVSRATSDVEAIGETMSAGLANIAAEALLIVFIFINIMLVSVELGLWTLVLLPILIIIVDVFRRILRKLFDLIRTINGRLTARINESLTLVFEVQNFNLTDAFIDDFAGHNREFREKNIKVVSYEALVYSIIEGLSFVAIGAVLILVAKSSLTKEGLMIGGIVAYIQWLWLIFPPIKQMGGRFAILQSAFAAISKIKQVMSEPLPDDDGETDIGRTDLVMRDVHFAYRDGEPVLDGIDLAVPQGGSVAIVGPTGSGKSTIIRLLVRQYEVAVGQGEILLGGVPICDLPRQRLKETIVLVPQEPSIFHESVFYNIALNRAEVTKEQVMEICRNIQADDFIRQLPGGYDAVLDSEGANLSMGQRQLIALARALASPAEILIFDEATANIDTKTELMIQQALTYVMQRKSTILIAHRLSTIRDVDTIVVIHKGRIADRGGHQELLERPGLYRKMYELQTRFE
jgi:ATP-binding cassette subfamily B multidrug efflux pump